MPKLCKLCYSPHRLEYEAMFMKGSTLVDIQKYAKEKYGEEYSYSTVQRHFQKHVKEIVEKRLKSELAHSEYLKTKLKENLQVAERLVRNLRICDEQLQAAIQVGVSNLTPDEKKILLQYIAEIRQTVELLLRWSEKIQTEPLKEEDIFERILFCLQDFPPELIQKFKARWVEFNLGSALTRQ